MRVANVPNTSLLVNIPQVRPETRWEVEMESGPGRSHSTIVCTVDRLEGLGWSSRYGNHKQISL